MNLSEALYASECNLFLSTKYTLYDFCSTRLISDNMGLPRILTPTQGKGGFTASQTIFVRYRIVTLR
jgi:hypothetical protein